MPTTKRRYAITETEQVSEALETAAHRWPVDRDQPSLLLKRLIKAGHEAVKAEVTERQATIRETSGVLTGVYEPGYLAALREDWE